MQALDSHDVFNQFDELTGINLLQAWKQRRQSA